MTDHPSTVTDRKKRLSFFTIIAWIGLAACLVGFGKTFLAPAVNGRFSAPVIIYIHGAFAFAWILLFVTQTFLIHQSRYQAHRNLGWVGMVIAIGIAITIIFAGRSVVQRDLKTGQGELAYSSFVGIITTALIFSGLVLMGLIRRGNGAAHKRWMLLATIVVLWPAWFRFRHYFPSIPRPDIWFAWVLADSLILVAWVWDKVRNHRIHPVLFWGGLFIILEQGFEVWAFGSDGWQVAAKWLYGLV